MNDIVSLHDLTLAANIGQDWWDRPRPQPVRITVHVHTDVTRAGASDNVADSIHYGHVANAVLALQAPAHVFSDLAGLAEAAAAAVLGPQFVGVHAVRIVAEAPKLLLQAQGLGVDITRPHRTTTPDKTYIKDLTLPAIIGVNPPERLRKQLVVTNVVFHRAPDAFPHSGIVRKLTEYIEDTEFLTLEAFVTAIARVACEVVGVEAVTVCAQKPSAVSFAQSSGVEITRNKAFFDGNLVRAEA